MVKWARVPVPGEILMGLRREGMEWRGCVWAAVVKMGRGAPGCVCVRVCIFIQLSPFLFFFLIGKLT